MNSPQQNDLFQSLSDLLHGQSNGIPRNLTQLGCISFVFSNCQLHQKKMCSSTISRFWTISHSKFTVAFVLLLLFISICINTTTLSAATSSAATSCSNSTFLATSFCNTLASEEFSCNLPTSSCNFITTSSWYFSWGEGDSLGRMINIPIHILIRFQCCTLCE